MIPSAPWPYWGTGQVISKNPSRAFVFYGITLGLAVLVAIAAPVFGEASPLVTMFTPAIATIIMLAFSRPRAPCARFSGSWH